MPPARPRGALRALCIAITASSLLGTVAVARADEASEAQLQFELGTAYFEQKRYAEANERFLASYRLVPNPRVGANIVRTYELLKRYAEAYNWCVTIEATFPDATDVVDYVAREKAGLAPRLAVLDVTTRPEGATLFVLRRDLGAVGQAPRQVAVDPARLRSHSPDGWDGTARILASLEGYHDAEVSVAVEKGARVPVELTLERRLGQLTVTSEPSGAVVRDLATGEALGETPLDTPWPVGPARLEVSLEEHATVVRDVQLREGEQVELRLELERLRSTLATLTVDGSPGGAEVRFRGRAMGRAPLTRSTLRPGAGELLIERPGRRPWRTRVVLESGAATRVSYALADPDDRHWPGWPWVGYGAGAAVLAGGLAVGIVARRGRDVFFDDPTPQGHQRVDNLNLAADLLFGIGGALLVATALYHLLRPSPPASEGRARTDR